MNLTSIVAKLNSLNKLVAELLCKVNDTTESDPTVPQFIKDLKESQITDLINKLETDLGTWS